MVAFHVAVDMCGLFVTPSKSKADLVSPYYWIGVSESYCFQKPIEVEFEHYGACDPSHYQLLCCEDDDESYTMRPVDYDLKFTKHEDISLCNFLTYHCCSLCLQHNHKDTNVNMIGAFYLKPENFQSLDHFTLKPENFESQNYLSVEVWFSFIASYCLNRNKELYESRGMKLDSSYQFEAASDENSTDYFKIQYCETVNGWSIDNGHRSKEIEVKKVNFRIDPNIDKEALKAKEESKLFPPYFKLYIKNPDSPYNTAELDSIFTIFLYKSEEAADYSNFKILVPKCSFSNEDRTKILSQSNSDLPNHHCYIPEFNGLFKYSQNIAAHWKSIASELGISEGQIDIIDINNQDDVKNKCYAMFRHWLEAATSKPLCWCHFVQVLREVGLCSTAEEVIAKYLKQCSEGTSIPPSPTGSLVQGKDTLNLSRLMRYLRPLNNVMECDLYHFVTFLLPDEGVKVAKAIRKGGKSGEEKIKEICDAFLNEETPSWHRLHKALEDAGFTDVAETVKLCHLE